MHYSKYITLLFVLLLASYCQSQDKKSSNRLLPKIEARIDSLYPHALHLMPAIRNTTDSIQSVSFLCNCSEGTGRMDITFDTNGIILNKSVYISIKDLPAAILDYMQDNYATGFAYNDDIVKNISSSQEVTYTLNATLQTSAANPASGTWVYILKFTGSGKFISVDKKWQNM